MILFKVFGYSLNRVIDHVISHGLLHVLLYLNNGCDCPAQPPVYCLMATVKEAKGILGKDISGRFPFH